MAERGRRPRSRLFLSIILAGLSLFNLLGALDVRRQMPFLATLSLAAAPDYLWLRDAVWAAALMALAAGLWLRPAPARRAALPALLLYLMHHWFDRLALGRSEYLQLTWPCAAAADLALLALTGALLRRDAAGPERRSPLT